MRRLVIIPVIVLLSLPVIALSSDGGTPPAVFALTTSLANFRAAHRPAEHRMDPVPERPDEPVGFAPVAVQQNPPAISAVSPGLSPSLRDAVTQAMTGFPGRYSVVVQDLTSGQRWAVGEQERYHPASTIKLPVALYALTQYREGRLGWNDGIVFTEADYESPGGGAFETAPFGGVYTVENLVGRALMYSNNVAVNMLGRHLGWDNIRRWTRSIGGELSRLADSSPQVTPLSELGWWVYLDRLSHEDPRNAELLMGPLREVTYSGRIGAGVPRGVPYLHKFGSYDGNFHDGGVVYGKRPYVLIVMTNGAKEYEADAAIARVSAAVYNVMTDR